MPSSIRHGAAGRRAFVVDRQRAAPLLHRAVVDDRNARRRDALADAAGESRGALAVEVAFEAVADRLVQQHAGPAGAEHDRHFAGRRGDRFEVGQRLGEGDVDRAVPLRLVEQVVVEIAAAKPVIAGFAAAVLLGDDLDAEANQRTNVGARRSRRRGRCRSRSSSPTGVTLTCATRGSRARAAASICWHKRDLVGERDQAQRVVGAVHRLVGACAAAAPARPSPDRAASGWRRRARSRLR